MQTKFSCLIFRGYLARRWCRHGAVALRGVTHNHSHDAAGQNDFEIVAMLKVCDDERQHKTNCETEQNAERHGIHLSRKNARRYAGDQTLNCRTKDDSRQLRSYSRSEPRRPAIDCAQHGPDQKSEQHFVHRDPPFEFIVSIVLYNKPLISFRPYLCKKSKIRTRITK